MIEHVQIKRHRDAETANRILNLPEVRPFIAPLDAGEIDLSPQLIDTRNVLLLGEHGGCLFLYVMHGIYEVHTFVAPEGRGAWAKNLLHSVAHWIFTRTPAVEVFTRIPRPLHGARQAAVATGMSLEFTREGEQRFQGEIVPVDIYSRTIQDWIKRAPFLEEIGADFHNKLNEAAAKVGVTDPAHGEDINHNRYVGAAMEMARAGFVQKCVAFYNRWAVAARHPIISLMPDGEHVKIDHNLVLGFKDGELDVTICH